MNYQQAKAKLIGATLRASLSLVEDKPQVTPASFIPHQPTERQRMFLELPHAEAFFGGAAGGGKSDALLMAALAHVDTPGYAALILRRTFQDLSKPGALLDRAHQWLSGSSATWNEQRKHWRFPNGAILAFGYLENENDIYQYQSAEYQFIGFDELTQFSERQYTYLFSRLRRLASADVPLRMRSASNPGGIGAEWVQARFVPDDWTRDQGAEMRVFEKAGRAFVPARLVDNPYLDQASYQQSLAELDEVTRAQLLEGDWQIRRRGNIYPTWSDGPDGHHVITWSQFQSVYEQRRIPSHWYGACGQDWGFYPDPCATIWNFTAGANGPLAGAVFCPAILTSRESIPDDVGEAIQRIEAREGWSSSIQYRVMSHEASSQQATYRAKLGLYFQKWKPDAHGGIAQMQHALRLRDLDKPHPFKPWLNGRPNYYVIVPDDQLANPKEDYGLALLRAEFAAYKYTEERITSHLGSAPIKPFDFFNHFMDAQRGIADKWFADIKQKTATEREEESLPRHARLASAPPIDAGWARDGWALGRIVEREAERRRNGSGGNRRHWSHELCDPSSDPYVQMEKMKWREGIGDYDDDGNY